MTTNSDIEQKELRGNTAQDDLGAVTTSLCHEKKKKNPRLVQAIAVVQ